MYRALALTLQAGERPPGARLRIGTYLGEEYLLVPVVAMVGDIVLRPMHSEGPELVPAAELEVAPAHWDGRPIVLDHPHNGLATANEPRTLEERAFGWIFDTRFENGRLKTMAWLSKARAARVGPEAVRVVERCEAGETVEISVGAWVDLVDEIGISNGQRYEKRWANLRSDHLAMLPEGTKGACSVEAGCGAPRANQERPAAGSPASESLRHASPRAGVPMLRASALAQARRPQFSGTESGAWSAPGLSVYVRYLHEGEEGPRSVGQASAALKREIAAHSLLGDPEANNMRDLTMFPVVNPVNGRLNERALRAVLGGRGAQADLPERAIESARDMARRLLNSEFGAKLEANSMNKKQRAAPRDATLDQNLREWLEAALVIEDDETAYLWVEAIDQEAGMVYYSRRYDGEASRLYRQSFALEGETVTLAGDETQVRRRVDYEDMPAPAAASELAGRIKLPAAVTRALEALGFRAAEDEGLSSDDLQQALYDALRAVEAGFEGVGRVYPFTNTVIYATRPEEKMLLWRRTYSLDEGGAITLNSDAERVEATTRFAPKPAGKPAANDSKAPKAAAGDCGCKGEGTPTAVSGNEPVAQEGDDMAVTEVVKALRDRLIACERAPFTQEDAATLDSLGEAKLRGLAAAFEGEEAPPAPKPPPSEPAAEKATNKAAAAETETVALPRDKYEILMAAAAEIAARDETEKARLVTELSAAQTEFSEQELQAMDVKSLQRTARMLEAAQPAAAVDFSGRARVAAATAVAEHAAPDSWGIQPKEAN